MAETPNNPPSRQVLFVVNALDAGRGCAVLCIDDATHNQYRVAALLRFAEELAPILPRGAKLEVKDSTTQKVLFTAKRSR